jgi:hypothetical protein
MCGFGDRRSSVELCTGTGLNGATFTRTGQQRRYWLRAAVPCPRCTGRSPKWVGPARSTGLAAPPGGTTSSTTTCASSLKTTDRTLHHLAF